MIEINDLTDGLISKKSLKTVAQKILNKEKRELDLSIVLVGPLRIKDLNKRYRKKNKTTDVLSFLYDNSGEIVICPPEVKKNVKRLNSSFRKEMARVLIHGILHLLGYDHQKGEKMVKKEEYYLSGIKSF